jgi:tRNA1(Val) A37 N6-methylase TrmN6
MSFGPTAREPSRGDVTTDAALGGRLLLQQPRRGHRFGHDAILLAAATGARAGEHVVELGAGVGAAGLALAARIADVHVTLVDSDEELVALASENARRNRFDANVRAVALDVGAKAAAYRAAGLTPGTIDRVMANPPFNDPARQNVSPDQKRAAAHAAAPTTLAHWTKAANRLLAPQGVLTLIWRADGLADVLAALHGNGFGDVAVLPVHPRAGAAAIRILVRAVKGSRGPLVLLPGFALNDAHGRPTAEMEDVARNGLALPLARP